MARVKCTLHLVRMWCTSNWLLINILIRNANCTRAVFAFCFILESCKTKQVRLECLCECLALQKALLVTEGSTINKISLIPQCSLVHRPFLYGRGEKGEGRKGLANNSTPTRIHSCIPVVSVDKGKCECQVGVSREYILCECVVWTYGFTFKCGTIKLV